jgi:leucyl/phenylalanyl-tRNA--protein transferase
MSFYYFLNEKLQFPDPEEADEHGILCIGGDLSIDRLKLAYQYGIFPWYNEGEPIIWWSLNPRFVLYPDDLKIAKSMRSYFNQQKFSVTYNQAFEDIIHACQQTKREDQLGTWITRAMKEAYINLHEEGIAHSVEVWNGKNLVGGLYGVVIGKIFSGESMFSLESNASKFGFISLVKILKAKGFILIDCQQETPHLGTLGAKPMLRSEFLEILAENRKLHLNYKLSL